MLKFILVPLLRVHLSSKQKVGLAYEIRETHILREAAAKVENDLDTQLKYDYRNIKPCFIDVFLYGYCYIGILTGLI